MALPSKIISSSSSATEDSTASGSLLLSRDELAALTGTKQAKRMSQWLQSRRWPFALTGRRGGFPQVARLVFVDRMTQVNVNPAGQNPLERSRPNFSALGPK